MQQDGPQMKVAVFHITYHMQKCFIRRYNKILAILYRLVGFYEEQGISINREPFGPLTEH